MAEKGGIDIAEDIIREYGGGIARRGLLMKGQMARGEGVTVIDEGQLTKKTLNRGDMGRWNRRWNRRKKNVTINLPDFE